MIRYSEVGEDEEISIKDVADSIVKAMDFKGEYAWDPSKADGQFRKQASNKKLLALMGGFQFTPFDQGASCSIHLILQIHGLTLLC